MTVCSHINIIKNKNKAIGHVNCDPLTAGFLYTAFHSKDFYFCRKWTTLLQKNPKTKQNYSSPPPPPNKKVCKHIVVNWLLDQTKKPSQSGKKKRVEVLLPDVKQSAPELVIDKFSSPDLGNVETSRDHFRRCYNCVTAPLCSHLVIFLEKNTQTTKSFKQTFFF